MKTIYTLLFAVLIFISCGEKKAASISDIIATNNITKIKAKKRK